MGKQLLLIFELNKENQKNEPCMINFTLKDLVARIPEFGKITAIIAVTIVVWWLFQQLFRRMILNLSPREHVHDRKVGTVIAVARSVITVALLGFVVTMIMSQLGISLGPVLTAAGVAGVAIGFGAQSLIKDLLNGFFLLVENQVKVGDFVEAAGNGGFVENITLRTLILRDWSGDVHIIPHGQINTVTNKTLDYSRIDLHIGIAYKESASNVIRVLTEEAKKMRSENPWKRDILGDPEVLAIEEFGDSAVIYRVRMKVKAGRQWILGRELRLRLKNRFDQEGIEIPFPHRTLYWGKDNNPPT